MKVLILGSGNIGSTIAVLLSQYDDYSVTLASHSGDVLESIEKKFSSSFFTTLTLDVSDISALKKTFPHFDIIVSALPFFYNKDVAKVACDSGCSYFDLTEDVKTTNAIKEIANNVKNNQVFMPQCGLAPGFIGIVGYGLTQGFDTLKSLKMRVGALPLYPTNHLKYNLSWSTDGLINEYCNPSEVIVDGVKQKVLALEGVEYFNLEGVEYETFNTSGGLGTLCETLEGKIESLDYKTIRYKGHRDLVDFLLNGLEFKNRRELLKEVFEQSIPMTRQDMVLVMVSLSGYKDGKFEQKSFAHKYYGKEVSKHFFSAIEMTTAIGICSAIDLYYTKKLPQKGFLGQENIRLSDFLENRFGSYYQVSEVL